MKDIFLLDIDETLFDFPREEREALWRTLKKRGFGRLSAQGASKTRINVMTVFESKGLEFSAVAVLDRGMTENEKYIAYTRALRELAIIEC